VKIIDNQQFNHPIQDLKPVASGVDLENLQNAVKEVFVDDSIKQYIVTLVGATRNHAAIYLGASPRGSLALFRTAQARALLLGRDYVLPDDVKALAEPVLAHRLVVRLSDTSSDKSGRTVISNLIETIPVPGTLVR
jgi:MoxR-like ATPase